ncbi:carboxylesterase/lipase family protein [Pendulispora albinea]|uniref:Carboxylic ester hydrolase n=1 Tax=Pendulispora albinea TaxID=2741071 RepID=A0ABZ2LVT9_9BACT
MMIPNKRSIGALAAACSGLFLGGCSAPLAPDGEHGETRARRDALTSDDEAIVVTESGPVKGALSDGHRSFRGIPYAAPPVGARRWQPPAPAERWTEVRDATQAGSVCVQGGGGGRPVVGSEDCLTVNVTTPRARPSAKPKPVMVWVHGGSFISGDGARYDPPRLAAQGDVVVVTINYRLGVFSLLAHPSLEGTNFGLLDQQAALRWVQRNAAAFGGDPGNVTLFGESAGGVSTCAQLTSPSSAGTFHRAIMASGNCTIDWPDQGLDPDLSASSGWLTRPEAEAIGTGMARGVGCADPGTAADCLRNLPAGDLLRSSAVQLPPAYGFRHPVYGTPSLPLHPAQALARGRFHRVPVISGSNLDEGRYFTLKFHTIQPITEERYRQLLATSYGEHADDVEAHYPVSAYASPALAWGAVITDRVLACPTLRTDRLLARFTAVHAYEFADRRAPAILPVPPGMPPGATHGSELPSLFDLPGFDPKFTEEQKVLSERMVGYWTQFARTGNPNTHGLPGWPRFRSGAEIPYVQSLAPGEGGIGAVDFASLHQCDFWANIR